MTHSYKNTLHIHAATNKVCLWHFFIWHFALDVITCIFPGGLHRKKKLIKNLQSCIKKNKLTVPTKRIWLTEFIGSWCSIIISSLKRKTAEKECRLKGITLCALFLLLTCVTSVLYLNISNTDIIRLQRFCNYNNNLYVAIRQKPNELGNGYAKFMSRNSSTLWYDSTVACICSTNSILPIVHTIRWALICILWSNTKYLLVVGWCKCVQMDKSSWIFGRRTRSC